MSTITTIVNKSGGFQGILKTPSNCRFPVLTYVWSNKANRTWMVVAPAAFLVQFLIFKSSHYPYANYTPDSYWYIGAAVTNADVNIWPVAYSKFLRLVGSFSHSDTIVVALQYFLLQVGSVILLFSIDYFLRLDALMRKILFLFVIFNPLPLYIANYISADALFIGFSLLWMTSLFWIIYCPRLWLFILQGLLLLVCFSLRYNAIYYPVVSGLAFFLSRMTWTRKLAGFSLGIVLILAFYGYTSRKMKEATGRQEFSAFSGWQLANNALYMYTHIPADERKPVPTRFAGLENMVRQHIDTLGKVQLTKDDSLNMIYYLWNKKGPLVQYMTKQWRDDSAKSYFQKWADEGPLYSDYGRYLIATYPLAFLQYWIAPNAVKFAVPPTEFLGTYNMGRDSVGAVAKDWFRYGSLEVTENNSQDTRFEVVEVYPIFAALVNVMFLLGLIGTILLKTIDWREYGIPQLLILVTGFWMINAAFSIFASPVVLRYQYFPILLCFSLGIWWLEKIWNQDKATKSTHAINSLK